MKTKLLFIFLGFTLQIHSQNITTIGLGYNFMYGNEIARDNNNNLYICDESAEVIVKIDPNNKTQIISAGNGKPSAIALDAANNLYVAYASPGLNGGKVFKMNNDGTNPVLFASPNIAINKMRCFGIYLWFLAPAHNHELGHIVLADGTVGYTNSITPNIGNAYDFTFDNDGNSYFATGSPNLLKVDNFFQSYSYTSTITGILCIDYCPNLGLIIGGMSDILIMDTSGTVITNYPLPIVNSGEAFLPEAVEAKEFQNAHFTFFVNGQFKAYDFKYPDNTYTLRGSKFNTPIGIALDNSNNIYINDYDVATGYNAIKKINPNDGSFSNIFVITNALGSLSQSNGLLYFADKTTNEIKTISINGGNSGGFHSSLNNPYLFKIFGSNEYITQRNSTSIKKLTFGFPGGYSSTNLGVTQDPKGFDFDNNGNLYVADSGFNTITKILPTGSQSTITSGLNNPSSVAIDNSHGLIYFTDTENNAVKRMNLDGSNITIIGSGFYKPESVCLNTANNKLYVTDSGNNLVKIIDLSGLLTVGDVAQKSDFTIYPNPTTDLVQISSNEDIKTVTLFDLSGKQIMDKDNPGNEISLAHYPRGMYMMNILFESGKTETRKIVKK